MNDVVQEVAREGVDRERRTVAASAGSLPLLTVDRIEVCGDGCGCVVEFLRHGRRVLLVVPRLDGSRVLVPVGVERIVLLQHQAEPVVVEPEDVADVTAVFEC